MATLRESYTAVVARNVDLTGDWGTEPHECAWAGEALFFVRVLSVGGRKKQALRARVQISPDGMHWADEGRALAIPPRAGVSFVRVGHFGGWLRLAGKAPAGATLRVMAYLVLKA
ncbi:MAG: hypothetical protein ACREUW_14265 [Burkholderiales bacterium]